MTRRQGPAELSESSPKLNYGAHVDLDRGDEIPPRDGFVYFTPNLDAAICADLQPGDLMKPGHAANFGASPRAANYAYFARTRDAAIWGADLAAFAAVRVFLVMAALAACSRGGKATPTPGDEVSAEPAEPRAPGQAHGAVGLPDCQWCGAREAPDGLDWDIRIAGPDEPGEPMLIEGTVHRADGTPAPGMTMYLYHTNAEGYYPKRGDEVGNGRRHGYLRNWLRTDERGRYRFTTIRPAPYPGNRESAHVHVTVLDRGVEYWLDSFVFRDDPLLHVHEERARGLGGSGVVDLVRGNDGVWRGQRRIVLPESPPDTAR